MSNYGNNNGQGEAASYYASAQQSQQQQYSQNQQSQQQDGPDGERGFLGAVGGGLAGGFGGNKIGNKTGHSKLGTILGAVAGAVAGHKAQDGVEEWKDNRDEEKEKKKREEEERKKREEEEKERKKREDEDRRRREEEDKKRMEQQQHQPQQQQHHSAPAPRDNIIYAGNFSGSARDIRLDEAGGEWRLTASCQRIDGSYNQSSLSLNQILENNQGIFRWVSGGGCPPPAPHNHCGGSYTVQGGDTLRDIAGRHPGLQWQDIARENNISNPDLIFPGQVLRIPSGGGAPPQGGHHGGGGNFAASARNIRLADNGRRLEADLLRDGNYCNTSIVLDERIGNENGNLKLKN